MFKERHKHTFINEIVLRKMNKSGPTSHWTYLNAINRNEDINLILQIYKIFITILKRQTNFR